MTKPPTFFDVLPVASSAQPRKYNMHASELRGFSLLLSVSLSVYTCRDCCRGAHLLRVNTREAPTPRAGERERKRERRPSPRARARQTLKQASCPMRWLAQSSGNGQYACKKLARARERSPAWKQHCHRASHGGGRDQPLTVSACRAHLPAQI